MPIYTVDNPSGSLKTARERVTDILGDNLVGVTCITPQNASRVSVETKTAIDSSKIAIALGRIPKQVAEEVAEPAVQSDEQPVVNVPEPVVVPDPVAVPDAGIPVTEVPVAEPVAEPVAAEEAPHPPVISPL